MFHNPSVVHIQRKGLLLLSQSCEDVPSARRDGDGESFGEQNKIIQSNVDVTLNMPLNSTIETH